MIQSLSRPYDPFGHYGNKIILVTGASGYLGGHLCRRLLALGGRVRGMVRNPGSAQDLQDLGVEVVIGDMTNPESLKQAVSGCHSVIHCAGLLNEFEPSESFRKVNVEGTRHLGLAALEANVVRFLHISSVLVYGFGNHEKITESSPRPFTGEAYCDSKREGEDALFHLHRMFGLPLVVLQPSQVYGPGDPTWTILPLKMICNHTMILVGRGSFQPLYISDAVEGIVAGLRKGMIGETYILSGLDKVLFRQYFKRLAAIANQRWMWRIPVFLSMPIARFSESISRIIQRNPIYTVQQVRNIFNQNTYHPVKARHELGFVPMIRFEEGLSYINNWWNEGK